jgi:arsenate reductase
MSEVTIYHNPRCSKSRQTLALLEEHGITPVVINYLEQPPSVSDLHDLLTALSMDVHEVLRTKEAPYRELNLAAATDAEIVQAITTHPILLERPIVVRGERAVIGRPPENVLDLLCSK